MKHCTGNGRSWKELSGQLVCWPVCPTALIKPYLKPCDVMCFHQHVLHSVLGGLVAFIEGLIRPGYVCERTGENLYLFSGIDLSPCGNYGVGNTWDNY